MKRRGTKIKDTVLCDLTSARLRKAVEIVVRNVANFSVDFALELSGEFV